jgi:hypothetical protein
MRVRQNAGARIDDVTVCHLSKLTYLISVKVM